MRIKDGIVIRQVEDEYVLVDVGKVKPKFNGMIKLNETSKDIVTLLMENDLTLDELLNKLLDIYDVDKTTLEKEVNDIIIQLNDINLLTDMN